MKLLYNSYSELRHYAADALKGTLRGLFRIVWAIVLYIVNTAVFCSKWLHKAIESAPMVFLLAFLFVMLTTNAITYIRMKAKLNTSEWRYDSLKMHTDSIMELYNVNKNYTRITSYE